MPDGPALAAARRLILANLPQRAENPLRVLGEGWDHVSLLVGEDLVLRLPRAGRPLRRLAQEPRVLACVAGRVPLSVPRMGLLGGVPPAAVYPLLEGVPAEMDAENRERIGGFLRALHRIPRAEIRAAGIGWVDFGYGGRGWEDGLRRFCRRAVDALRPHLAGQALRALQKHLGRFLRGPQNFRFMACLIHADLAPEHLLADPATGRLRAVIDFGDAGLGDPAYDVRPEWTPSYGTVGAAFARRQAFYRSLEPLHGALHAAKTGDAEALAAAIARLDV